MICCIKKLVISTLLKKLSKIQLELIRINFNFKCFLLVLYKMMYILYKNYTLKLELQDKTFFINI